MIAGIPGGFKAEAVAGDVSLSVLEEVKSLGLLCRLFKIVFIGVFLSTSFVLYLGVIVRICGFV